MTDQYCTRCGREFREYEDVIVITGGMIESSLAFPDDFAATLNDSPHIEVMCSACFDPKPNRVVVEVKEGVAASANAIQEIRAEQPGQVCVIVKDWLGAVVYGIPGGRPIKQLNCVKEEAGAALECTDQCKEYHARAEQLRQEWREKWPQYCKKCEGWGGFWYSFDPSPAGVSLSSGSLEDFDPCPECYEQGICPRCGDPGFDGEDEGPCQKCGWDYSIDAGLPAEAECFCWERIPWEEYQPFATEI